MVASAGRPQEQQALLADGLVGAAVALVEAGYHVLFVGSDATAPLVAPGQRSGSARASGLACRRACMPACVHACVLACLCAGRRVGPSLSWPPQSASELASARARWRAVSFLLIAVGSRARCGGALRSGPTTRAGSGAEAPDP